MTDYAPWSWDRCREFFENEIKPKPAGDYRSAAFIYARRFGITVEELDRWRKQGMPETDPRPPGPRADPPPPVPMRADPPPPPPDPPPSDTVIDFGAAARKRKPKPENQADAAGPPDADDDLARLFIAQRPTLRYVAPWGRWMEYDGKVWTEDGTLSVFSDVRRCLREFAASAPDKRRRDLLSANTVAAVERLARSDTRAAATIDQWDADDLLLNTPLGHVTLNSGELGPHAPDAYCSKITAVGPRGECKRWWQFLAEVTNEDTELMDFLQRVAGYAATGLTHEHALFFFYGRGANGKGTFLNTLVKLMKDYATVAPMEVFTESATDRHPTELAMLRVVRLVVSQETEEGRRWAESRIKGMTGGDPITARFMRQDFFTFQPKFKLFIAGNHKPKLRNVDDAIRRRLHLIPFTVTIPPEKRDPGLSETLMKEAEGIMGWIVQGATEYHKYGLAPPACVRAATESYFAAEDLFGQWLEDRCERGPEHWEPSTRLFKDWQNYAERAGLKAGNRVTFAERLDAEGCEPGRASSRGGRYWSGLRLIPEPADANQWWDK